MHTENEPYCLVLGGGGAKGVYHIGVWQALTELGIPINAFIGNSIGAIISSFLAQGAEDKLMDIAKSMKLSSLIRLHKDKAITDEQSLKSHSLSYWQGVYRNIVDNKGLDTTPMREILESSLDEDCIRKSGFDFGITTVNLTDFRPREVFVENMEPGHLINYVMASAAFPGFSNPNIEGKKYLDGGIYDNVPFTMAKRRGYRKIILVDVSGIGMNRRPKTDGTQTVYIKNSIDMGNAFDFSPEFIEQFWQLGYLDTMRTFDQLLGSKFFVIPNPAAEQDFESEPFQPFIKHYPDTMKHDKRHLLKTLEVCAELLDVDRIHKFSYDSLSNAIVDKTKEVEHEVTKLLEERDLKENASSSQLFDAFLKEMMENRKRGDNPYYYLRLLRFFKSTKALQLAEKGLIKLNPELNILLTFLQRFNADT